MKGILLYHSKTKVRYHTLYEYFVVEASQMEFASQYTNCLLVYVFASKAFE